MAAEGMPFPWRWVGGMVSAILKVIWEMSDLLASHDQTRFFRAEVVERKSDQLARPAGDRLQTQSFLLLGTGLELETRFTAAGIRCTVIDSTS